jgi:magnesium-transporting ATPase (P-type)
MIKNNSYGFRNRIFSKSKIVKLIIVLIVIISVMIYFPHLIRNTYIVTITNKRIIRSGNNDTYLIYTQMENGNIKVFKNTNSLLEFKISSEDVFWALKITSKYEIKAYGLNIPLLKYYQNIIKVKGVK